MIQSIIKRDGRVVLYEQSKIASAVLKSLEATGEGDAADAARVANAVQADLEAKYTATSPNIEAIQDAVEQELMNHGFNATAKAYILYRANRTRVRRDHQHRRPGQRHEAGQRQHRRQHRHGFHAANRCGRRQGL